MYCSCATSERSAVGRVCPELSVVLAVACAACSPVLPPDSCDTSRLAFSLLLQLVHFPLAHPALLLGCLDVCRR